MNGVAMARHGLILNHNEATSPRKVSRYLPGLRDAIKISKMVAKVNTSQKTGNSEFPHFSIYRLPINHPGGLYVNVWLRV